MIRLVNKTDLLCKKFFLYLRGKWIIRNLPNRQQFWIIVIIMVNWIVAMVRLPTTVVQA